MAVPGRCHKPRPELEQAVEEHIIDPERDEFSRKQMPSQLFCCSGRGCHQFTSGAGEEPLCRAAVLGVFISSAADGRDKGGSELLGAGRGARGAQRVGALQRGVFAKRGLQRGDGGLLSSTQLERPAR